MSTVIREVIRRGALDQGRLQDVINNRLETKRSLQGQLIAEGHLQGETLFRVAQEIIDTPGIDLDETPVVPHLLPLIPVERAVYHDILPIRKEGNALLIAMSDPSDVAALDEIRFATSLDVKPLLCRHGQIAEYIGKYYQADDTVQQILKDTLDDARITVVTDGTTHGDEIVDLAQLRGDSSSFVKFVNKIIFDAVEARASDIHIEPQGKDVVVRYRIDGQLKNIIKVPRDLQLRLAARIKLLARMDIAEQRRAQDGRIKVEIGGKKVDLRISLIPVFYGEKIVLRILDSYNAGFDLDRLGFQRDDLEVFRNAIKKPQGVVLVTGPTGSGKTTTLYAALQHIKCETKNIVTIEDPIEYLIEGINQLQLSRFKDVTFATGLRSILRQDPDVVLVGEIRDRETAEIAFRASLTGHLVFSTLHTNSSVASITRLKDIGIEPYLLASSVSLFVAQRLVRLVCPNCCEQERPDDRLLTTFQSYLERIPVRRFYKGRGCDQCNGSGFYGRTSIFEMLKIDENIKESIHNGASEGAILKEALANGMRTLAESGVLKVAEGLTTLEEVSRVVDVVSEKSDTFSYL